jgi:hypothetical protein
VKTIGIVNFRKVLTGYARRYRGDGLGMNANKIMLSPRYKGAIGIRQMGQELLSYGHGLIGSQSPQIRIRNVDI